MINKKIIHYCWFGPSELGPLNRRCIESWRTILPEYEIMEWSQQNTDMRDPLKKKLYRKKQWAFLSDLVRFEKLYEYGGMYLDTDVEVISSFDPIVDKYDFAIGYETDTSINAAVIFASPKNDIVRGCVEEISKHYKYNREMLPIPEIITPYLQKVPISRGYLAPKHVFYPFNPYDRRRDTKQLMFSDITGDTLAIHHYQKSWSFDRLDKIKKIVRALKKGFFNNEAK